MTKVQMGWTTGEGAMPTQFGRKLPNGYPDPVVPYRDGWYFWDSSWSERYGPYPSEEEARKGFNEYANF